MAYNDYKAVTPVGTENPKQEGWYEKAGSVYYATTDTSVQVGTTYYVRGYLVKVGDYIIPFRFIKYETFQAVWEVVDFDSYRDADGELHRDAVSERRIMKVEWETPDMSDTEIRELLTAIQSQYIHTETVDERPAKACNVTAYMPEEGEYKTDKCYLTSDVNFSIRYADANGIRYNPVRFAFIGYGTNQQLQP